jgi:integrase
MKSNGKGPLAVAIDLYLAHKRALGKRLFKVGQQLYLLDSYLLEQQVAELRHLTPSHVDGFIASRPRHAPRSYNGLLGALRGLFDWLVIQEILPESPLRCEPRRVTPGLRPFLFNPDQVRRLLEAARQLPCNPRAQNRGEIYRMIFVLLYGLGLRVGEVSRLCRKDIDLENRLLIIRQTKFGKDRLVPFGPRVSAAIVEFLEHQEPRYGNIPPDDAVFSFVKHQRTPIYPTTISSVFHELVTRMNLEIPAGVAPPHLHCLRHSFAVGTLLRWYQAGVDPMSRLFDLSTFLGHVSPSSTAYYLTITTELLECASARFGHFATDTRRGCLR